MAEVDLVDEIKGGEEGALVTLGAVGDSTSASDIHPVAH